MPRVLSALLTWSILHRIKLCHHKLCCKMLCYDISCHDILSELYDIQCRDMSRSLPLELEVRGVEA
jgi:hypothetical protein